MKLHKILLILLLISPVLMIDCSSPPDAYPAKLMEMIETHGVVPDVGYVDALQAPEFIRRDWLKPIPDEVELDGFYPRLLEYFQHDGQIYAVPVDFQPVTLLINEELFDKYGLAPPNTWDELVETAWIIQDGEREAGNQDFYGLGLTAGIWNFLPFLYQAGGSLLDPSGMLALNTDQAKDAFTFYTGLSRDGPAFGAYGDEWPYWGAYGGDGVLARFEQGKIAMCFGGPGMYYSLKRQGAPVKVIEPLEGRGPAGRRATIALVRGYGLFGDPDTPASPAAVDFLRFLTSEEAMKLWIGDSETLPDYMPAREDLREAWLDVHPGTEAFMNSVRFDYIPSPPQLPLVNFATISELDQLAAKEIREALRPDLSADKALDHLHALQEEGSGILGPVQLE